MMEKARPMPKQIGDIRLFELPELEDVLEVNNATLRTYIRTGKLAGRKVGNKWYVSEDGLRAFFLEKQTRKLSDVESEE